MQDGANGPGLAELASIGDLLIPQEDAFWFSSVTVPFLKGGKNVSIKVDSCSTPCELGDAIRELFLKHGNFQGLEMEVAKISRQSSSNKLEGGWHNEVSLREILKWDEPCSSK